MAAEQANNIISWWEELSFPGKELFKLDENGVITLCERPLIKERVIAAVNDENAETIFKNLIEKFNTNVAKLKEIETEWQNTEDKMKFADRINHYKDFLATGTALGDFENLAVMVNEWDKAISILEEANIKAKLEIVEQAESLADSDQWKETTQAYKDITDKWKQTGYVNKIKNDELWNRIEAAKQKFFDKKRAHQDDEEKDFLQNLDLKIELAELAESLANSENWKSATEEFQKIIEKWKTIGRTLPRKNEELWQRIMTAKNTFYDRKKAHYNLVQAEQEASYTVKISIVERAEALKDSTEWNATAQAYAALMDEWKKAGRLMAEKGEELWKRFTTAQEFFFENRRQHLDKVKAVHEANYQLKSALVKKAEEIKNSSRWGEVTVEMNRLFDEWKKIGPVAKEHHQPIWETFIAARKHFFARKDSNREQRKVHAETQRSQRTEQAHSLVYKMQQEIAIEEEKLADFENSLANVTDGKKANELRDHLTVLINDCKTKLKRLHEKLSAGQDELKFVEEQERQRKEGENKPTE